jgi:uncharacterized protein YuzE
MQMYYDDEHDILYMRLSDAETDDSADINAHVTIEFDRARNIVGIQIMDVSECLAPEDSAKLARAVVRAA